ncbi:hypothetical protein DPMN_069725 [Dreissena polymorpha]|uniref:Uncharacterized protein n=1 Tax=Dreissena polymorpha TaxID=45954 RepID=A0A9D4BX26_DREPO|nr:hypothetical protein DPMN_069725 [Dreissena polymorpha]
MDTGGSTVGRALGSSPDCRCSGNKANEGARYTAGVRYVNRTRPWFLWKDL